MLHKSLPILLHVTTLYTDCSIEANFVLISMVTLYLSITS